MKRHHYVALFILVLSNTFCFAQNLKKFLSAFPPVKLPFCVSYSEQDFLTEAGVTGDDTCISYKGETAIDYADSITFEDVRTFLWSDSEKNAYDSTKTWQNSGCYYSIGSIASANNFLILLYGTTNGSTETSYCSQEAQYLCTLTKAGKLISEFQIGSAGFRMEGLCGRDSNISRPESG